MSLVFQVIDNSNPFLYILPDGHHISQLLSDLDGILGPLLYGAVGLITRSPRSSILSIAVFFIVGIILLWRVDMKKGEKVAVEEERAVQEAIRRRASSGDQAWQG